MPDHIGCSHSYHQCVQNKNVQAVFCDIISSLTRLTDQKQTPQFAAQPLTERKPHRIWRFVSNLRAIIICETLAATI